MKFFKSKQQKSQDVDASSEQKPAVTSEPAATAVKAPASEPTKPQEEQPDQLMARLTKIADEYNQTRGALQQKLFFQLDQLNGAQKTDQQTLAEVEEQQAGLKTKIAELQVVDTSELDALLAKSTEQVDELAEAQTHQTATVKAAAEELAVLTKQLAALKQQLAALQADSQALTEKFRTETDPLAILNMADAMRTQVEKNATKQKQLQAELQEVEAQHAAQSQVCDDETAKEQDLQKRLASRKEARADLNKQRDDLLSNKTQAAAAAQKDFDGLEVKRQALNTAVAKRAQQVQDAQAQLHEWFGSTHRVNALNLDEGGMFVFVIDTFLPKREGELAKLVQYLLQAGIEKVGLYSSYFDINLQYEIQSWATQHELDSSKLEVINPLLQLQTSGVSVAQAPIQLPEAASQSWNAEHTELTLRLATANRTLQVRYYADQPAQISDITYSDDGRAFKHSFFDRQGHLLANAMFDEHGALSQEEYYRQDGVLVLTITYTDGQQRSVEVFDRNGVLRRDFADSQALTQWWLADAFEKQARVVGCFTHPDYALFLSQPAMTAVPYLTEADTAGADFEARIQATKTSKFIVANSAVAQGLVQVIDRDVELLQLNNVNLPFLIGSPTA